MADLVSRDPSQRRQLGRNGRRYVNQVHDPVAVGNQWITLFDELLGLGQLPAATPDHARNREAGVPILGASSLR
jgi:hypothetical protein